MERKTVFPDDEAHWLELRTKDLTSTDMAALFGLSPYLTEFELWHRKKSGAVPDFEQTERMAWGNRLEAAIAEGVAVDHGWNIRHMTEFTRIPEARIGSSFDYCLVDVDGEDQAILEIKNVDGIIANREWVIEDGDLEAPPHIELQVQHQMLVSGLDRAWIAALIGGNRVVLIEREADQAIHKKILDTAGVFWASIDADAEPTPDFKRDARFIASLYGYAEPGKVIDVSDNEDLAKWVESYKDYGEKAKHAKEMQDAAKSQILADIGDAAKAIGDGFTISAGTVEPKEIAYTRRAYRNFKINVKKIKEVAS